MTYKLNTISVSLRNRIRCFFFKYSPKDMFLLILEREGGEGEREGRRKGKGERREKEKRKIDVRNIDWLPSAP